MECQESKRGEVQIFELAGKLMGDKACEEIVHRVDDLIAGGLRYLVVDMARVRWMNSQATAHLIMCLTKLRRVGGDLRLSGVAGKVEYYMRLTKLDTVIQTFASIDAAVSSYTGSPDTERGAAYPSASVAA